MDTITIPNSKTLQERIAACEEELRDLRRLLRMAQSAERAEAARRERERPTPTTRGGRADVR